MLYVMFSENGRYSKEGFIEGAVSPVVLKKDGKNSVTLTNGGYDCGLQIKTSFGSDSDELRLAPSDGKTVYILAQDSTATWYSGSHYGSKFGGVQCYRIRDTDVVIYQLDPDGWFVSGEVVYHNMGGVLRKYDRDTVLGWESWDSLAQWFLDETVIDFRHVTAADIEFRSAAIPGRHLYV